MFLVKHSISIIEFLLAFSPSSDPLVFYPLRLSFLLYTSYRHKKTIIHNSANTKTDIYFLAGRYMLGLKL